MRTQVDDRGDTATTVDDLCTRYTFAPNTSAHLIDYPSVEETVGVSCSTAPTLPGHALGAARYFYDNATSHGTVPTVGNVTKVDRAASYTGSTTNWIKRETAGYDSYGRVTSQSDALDRTTTTVYTHGTQGLLTSVKTTNPALHDTTITVDPARGLPMTATDANGKVTTGAYDALGRLLKVWLPGRATNLTGNAEYVYTISKTTASHVQAKALGPNGNQIISFTIYDGLLRTRQTQATAPDGKRTMTDTGYDARGLVAKQSSFYNNASAPTGVLGTFADTAVDTQTRHTYDGLQRPTVEALWSLNVLKMQTAMSYDGDRVNVDPPAGSTATTTMSDARGRTTALRQYHGGAPTGGYDQTSYGHDRLGRLTSVTDPAGNDWSYGYDLLGRTTSQTDPDAGSSTLGYDNADQLVTSTDGRGETLWRKYDTLGRIIELRDDSATGALRVSRTYDTVAKGQPTASTRHVGTDQYTTAVTGYTDLYAPTGSTVTVPAVEGNLAGAYTASATYKVDGSPATTVLPALAGLPAETLNYGYSDAGLPTTLTGAGTYVASTAYHFDGQTAQRLLGAAGKQVRQTLTPDPSTRRLKTAQVDTENQTTPGTFDDRSTDEYGYDQVGNVTTLAGKTAGVTDQVECFRYDYLRRLTDAWTETSTSCASPQRSGVDPYRLSWTYDSAGNRRTQTSHSGTGSTTATYTYPAAGANHPHTVTSIAYTGQTSRTDSYGYDPGGYTTTRTVDGVAQTLTWDAEGHLTTTSQPGQNTSYLYDADGNRLLRRDGTGATVYLGATELRLTGSTGQVSGTRYYSHGGAVVGVRTSSGLTWLVADHHGTNQLAIDPTTLAVIRRRSMPFGEPRGAQPVGWPGEKGFVNGTQDPTGLTHLGAREYDPTTGRFISADPIIDFGDPQQMNGYAYAHNNPTSSSDPSGLRDCDYADCDPYGNDSTSGRGNPNKPGGGKPGGGRKPDEQASRKGNGRKNGDPTPEQSRDIPTFAAFAEPRYCGYTLDGSCHLSSHTADQVMESLGAYLCEYYNECALRDAYWRQITLAGYELLSWIPILGIPFSIALAKEALDNGDYLDVAIEIAGAVALGKLARVAKVAKACSFSGETHVLMADGTTKPIKDVEVGDVVLATDPETGEHGPRVVTGLWIHDDLVVDLKLDGETITTTEDHPFWNATDHQWQQAQALDLGDRLLTANGATLTVDGLAWATAHTAPAYNLTVDDIHTYYVIAGDTPALVHNAPPDGCRITSSVGSPQITSRTVFNNQRMRIDIENPVPGKEGAANIHVQFMGRGADSTKYYYNPSNGAWISETGQVLSSRVAGQIPQSAIDRAFQFLGITP